MTIDQFRKSLSEKPFRPFEICLADGQRFKVHHPENVAMSKGGRTLCVFEDEAGTFVDLLLVTALRELKGARSNGKH